MHESSTCIHKMTFELGLTNFRSISCQVGLVDGYVTSKFQRILNKDVCVLCQFFTEQQQVVQ